MAFSKLRILRTKKPAAEVQLGERPAAVCTQKPGAEVTVGARMAALSTQTPADHDDDNDQFYDCDPYDEDGDYKMKDLPQVEMQKEDLERAMKKTAATTTKR
ncbi:hypothetical protein Asppvi_005842 [Aspergillus pseudoviridinutans]|uniref:Uncharacterized protein n=1 Tax=Aspergillus pseudoviridinutans TaxID=1517512 RepID=A0A9P3BEP5_9EURO|nr:uncharacterized protein Asppvi_005842 [Aspergillus pseudoviridinutans]GIJ86943.1 hypothetical protein Asppvi_005842 [Aspergillus pseudoviridinutans]